MAFLNENFELNATTKFTPWVHGADIIEALRDPKSGAVMSNVATLCSFNIDAASRPTVIVYLYVTADPETDPVIGSTDGLSVFQNIGDDAILTLFCNGQSFAPSESFFVHRNLWYAAGDQLESTEGVIDNAILNRNFDGDERLMVSIRT